MPASKHEEAEARATRERQPRRAGARGTPEGENPATAPCVLMACFPGRKRAAKIRRQLDGRERGCDVSVAGIEFTDLALITASRQGGAAAIESALAAGRWPT